MTRRRSGRLLHAKCLPAAAFVLALLLLTPASAEAGPGDGSSARPDRAAPRSATVAPGAKQADVCEPPVDAPAHLVAKVLDAETLVLDGGRVVRLVGALAPQAPGAGSTTSTPWPPAEAARRALEAIVLARPVMLAPERPRRDRDGRLLAQVHVGSGEARTWVQGRLVGEGLARAARHPDAPACLAALVKLEGQARAERRGLWGEGIYRIYEAESPAPLAALRYTFQIVEGTMREVGQTREAAVLNFGQDWRTDFSVGVARSELARFRAAGIEPRRLKGRRVRVRGWLGSWNGPFLEIRDPAEIELLDGGPAGRGE